MKKVNITINGLLKEYVVSSDRVLLDLLREDLHLTGAKQSCDRKGQCGACTVIVDGKAVRSCLKKVTDLDGASVITVEGLGTPENPHLIQEAFVLSGAVQCGFCTPGMIMAAKALLDQNDNPNDEEIKKALVHNLCRCTGYAKIIEAVKLAGEFMRGKTTPDKVRPKPKKSGVMGVSIPRPSSMIKACGVAQFSADIKLQDALEIAVTRSTEAHAVIKSVDTSAAEKMPGVAGVMTAKDIKGTNKLKMIFEDQPLLCDEKVRLLGDPIAIVAAETKEQALAAADAVKVVYDPLPVIRTAEEGMAEGAAQLYKEWPNLCFGQPQKTGDPNKAIAESKAIVEAEFKTQLNHQAALEPEATVAYMEGEGEDAQLVVIGRSIDIHTHMAMIQEALAYENVRYEEAFSGGQFGIKAAITSEGISAAAALHFKRAVRYIPSIHESMVMSTKRHPFKMKVKLGADANGKLTIYANDVIVENGAYMIIGLYVIFRALWMMNSSYYIPCMDVMTRLVYTNDAPGGAARGAGPPQTAFALESAIDMLAEKLGMDPLEFRKINSLKPGQAKSTGQPVTIWPFPELCDAIKPKYEKAKKEAAGKKSGKVKRGVGIAAHSFGIASPGDQAILSVELDPDDCVTIYAAIADPGEGNDSMLSQIAAQVLDLPLEKIRLVTRTTEKTAMTGPAAGSRMTYMGGGSLVNGVEQLKKAMEEAGGKTFDALKKAGKATRYIGTKKNEFEGNLDPETGQGPSFEVEVHSIQMAEVEVDTETGEVCVVKMTGAVDSGNIIHPQNFTGQMEGGMDQGVGYALREEYIHGKTKDWVTFKFPTMKTAFDMEVITRETPREKGPLGAIGIGEMTMVNTAPAVINAIYDACGVRIYDLPATPEKIKAALGSK